MAARGLRSLRVEPWLRSAGSSVFAPINMDITDRLTPQLAGMRRETTPYTGRTRKGGEYLDRFTCPTPPPPPPYFQRSDPVES